MDFSAGNELDFAMNFEDGQQAEADKKLMVLFFKGTIKNEAKSIAAGRPIFDEIDLVKIFSPGSRDNFVGDATPDYQARFPRQWERYKKGQEQQSAAGTPLNQLGWLTVSQIAEFNAVNVFTIEQLCGMPDAVSQKFMGHHQIKQRAQAYLDAAASQAPFMQMEAQLKERDDKLAEQAALIAAMQAQLNELSAANKAKGGVPLSPPNAS